MDTVFQISETKEHGVILRISDIEVADEFDDFLNEDGYVLSDLKFETDYVDFYFGQVSSVTKVREMVERFKKKISKQ